MIGTDHLFSGPLLISMVFRLVAAFFCQYIISCQSGEQPPVLTFTVTKADRPVTIEETGEIKAKRSFSIITPVLQHQSLKIAQITEEGGAVKKGEQIIQLESETIANNYISAGNELEIAVAEADKRNTELELERLLLESRIKSLEASVAVSRLRLKNLSFEPVRIQEIEKLEIEKNEIDLRKLQDKLASLESIQKEERLRFQLKIKQEKNKRDQAAQYLGKLNILAPVDGILTYAESWFGGKIKEGDQMYPNQPIAEIPDLSQMQLTLKLGETEAQKCKEGQRVEISSHFFPGTILDGKVSRVNRVALPVKRGSKVKKVEVLVDIDSSRFDITPGISAKGRIFISENEEVYAVPAECVFDKDSLKIVYVFQDGDFIPRIIAVGRYTEDFVHIQDGLADGDRLAMREPEEDDIEWPDQLTVLHTNDRIKTGAEKLSQDSH